MHALKIKLLEELMGHMKGHQGNSLKSMMDESKKSPLSGMPEGSPEEEKMESPSEEALEDKLGTGDKPKGISIEKVSLTAKPKIPGINMGKHHRIAAPGPKDSDLKAMIDKKSGGVGAEPSEGDSEMGSEMSDDELKELLSKYGI